VEECRNQSPKTVLLVLVGNKYDLKERRQVTFEEGQEYAKKNKMIFFECSAKSGYNIEEVFTESAKCVANRIEENFYDLNSEVFK
jgi:GTPase SAR1 family protein